MGARSAFGADLEPPLMNRQKSSRTFLVPLWVTAALLLGAYWPAEAQELSSIVPEAAQEELQEPAVDPTSGVQTEEGDLVQDDLSAAQQARLAREEARGGTPLERLTSLLGLGVFVLIGWGLSVNRARVNWRLVAWGIGLQFIFALLILKTRPGEVVFEQLNVMFTELLAYTEDGARFLFGGLTQNNVPVGATPGATVETAAAWANTGAFFAFSVLPTIIFFSSLMTLLYYFGVMQWIVRGFAWVMIRTMGTSGGESLSAAGNIFVGQTEAPLLVKPFIKTMTNSELHAVMTGGFATVAGGVMAAYVGLLVAFFPDIAGHLIAASVMSAPAALAISKIMYPETDESVTRGEIRVELEKIDANAIDAAARGASEGLFLALNVGAMLLAFLALLALMNGIVGGVAGWFGAELSIQMILGWLGAPLAWLMGTPWKDALEIGTLLGEKTALNEFVAYLHLAEMLQGGSDLSGRSVVIATYALAGFANFSSIAIQIGGIGGLAPERRSDLSRLGLRAMIGGTLAAFMTASVVGILI